MEECQPEVGDRIVASYPQGSVVIYYTIVCMDEDLPNTAWISSDEYPNEKRMLCLEYLQLRNRNGEWVPSVKFYKIYSPEVIKYYFGEVGYQQRYGNG